MAADIVLDKLEGTEGEQLEQILIGTRGNVANIASIAPIQFGNTGNWVGAILVTMACPLAMDIVLDELERTEGVPEIKKMQKTLQILKVSQLTISHRKWSLRAPYLLVKFICMQSPIREAVKNIPII